MPLSKQPVHHLPLLVHHNSLDFIHIRVPVIHLDKCEFANANTAFSISNGYFSIMLYPSPPTENVVYACGDFIPHVEISILWKHDIQGSNRQDFHRLPPELVFPSDILPKHKILGFTVTGRNGWMMANLF